MLCLGDYLVSLHSKYIEDERTLFGLYRQLLRRRDEIPCGIGRSMNFAPSRLLVKNKATETPHGCIICNYHWHWFTPMLIVVFYIYTFVGLSALLVSTRRAMRRPIDRGTSDRTGYTLEPKCKTYNPDNQIYNNGNFMN